MDEGLIELSSSKDAKAFLEACATLRVWDRELKVDLDAEAFLENS